MLVTLWVQKVDFWKQRETQQSHQSSAKKENVRGYLISIFESLFCFGNELYMKVEALTEIA